MAEYQSGLSAQLDVVKMLTEAVADGIGQIEKNLNGQSRLLLQVMEFCESLQAGQSEIRRNQA